MDQLVELLKQIQDLAGVAIDALSEATGGGKGEGRNRPAGPPHEGGGRGGPQEPPPEGGEGGPRPPRE